MKKKLIIMFYTILAILAFIAISILVIINQPQFGKHPDKVERKFFNSYVPYVNGTFQNQSPTPIMTNNGNIWNLIKLYYNKPKTEPSKPIPSIKTDLLSLDKSKFSITWFGHSSYLIKLEGRNILVDPVFSEYASPFDFGARAYKGTDIYKTENMPEIDLLIITHDHYDHLDYKTVLALRSKVKKIVCSLGVGAHLRFWGYNSEIIDEMGWGDYLTMDSLQLICTPARHFSGRGFLRGKTLWSSFVLQSPSTNIYIGGDSGYDYHFKEIGQKYGPFDLAILECGQYGYYWANIHMLPEEVAIATTDLQAKALLPVHYAKFTLSVHPWNEPIIRLKNASVDKKYTLHTPMIGQTIFPKENNIYTEWWIEQL
jgi:L-ascorbate metabolism protein UlaG (beta-lactamase superfamily)